MPDKQPKKTDPNAPALLTVTITDPSGKEWGRMQATSKIFSSGSVGFYAGQKLANPESGERYQVGLNVILIGSKPD